MFTIKTLSIYLILGMGRIKTNVHCQCGTIFFLVLFYILSGVCVLLARPTLDQISKL